MEILVPEFEEQGASDSLISGDIMKLQPGAEANSFCHYIIPTTVWKANVVGRKIDDGEYRYFYYTL